MAVIANQHRSHTVIDDSTTPVTVFTGFLGAGKTTAILNILKRVNPEYNIVLLKNEFGDAETDSALVRESHVQVTEMTNGCLCCVLVGQMKRALEEMKEKFHPDRIIIETSGSAFPAPIAWQIREMESSGFHLDAILTVIDCVNFCGYEDTSYTARLQAQYTDLILLNKWENISERQLDLVVDHVNDLNTDTPKVKINAGTGVNPEVIFGLDTSLFSLAERESAASEVSHGHHSQEIDLIEVVRKWTGDSAQLISSADFVDLLKHLPSEDVYRVKGLVRLSDAVADEADTPAATPLAADVSVSGLLYIVNHAFGRYTFTPLTVNAHQHESVLARLTVMGNGLRMYLPQVQKAIDASDDEISCHWAH
ncbi:hypothetical protein IW148_005789 [Coemansia sp. RSA 1199]|nr:hypothetical protein IW148_005789 [Coemansia sp. RSA 1199]